MKIKIEIKQNMKINNLKHTMPRLTTVYIDTRENWKYHGERSFPPLRNRQVTSKETEPLAQNDNMHDQKLRLDLKFYFLQFLVKIPALNSHLSPEPDIVLSNFWNRVIGGRQRQ
jgi:hypothetical protein